MTSRVNLIILTILLISFTLFGGCSSSQNASVSSPDGRILVQVVVEAGVPRYSVDVDGKSVVFPSRLGFVFENMADLSDGLKIVGQKQKQVDQTWEQVWGETKKVRDHHNELLLNLQDAKGRRMDLVFRAFNDGIGFRYLIPQQEGIDSILVSRELTEFHIAEDPTAWWIPANFDSYEMLYQTTPLSEVPSANTPITMQREDGLCLSIHEAALTNYAGMTLKKGADAGLLECNLVPWPDGLKVRLNKELVSPWRTIQITEKPGDLITSTLILNLNDPCKIEKTDWIQPMKYVGIWWGMHLGTETWTMGPRHGATTKNAIRYIDFAAENGIGGFLAEGWNTGWENWGAKDAFDQVTPYEDYDIKKVAEYAREKGVAYIGHHETGGDIESYERFMDPAFKLLQDLGSHAVKTGYAGGIFPRGHHHHDQMMVNHYRKVVETAAKYELMVDAHEPIKPTGIRRTWPNMMTREGVRGQEWNGWSEGNPPEHYTILPFTRMLAGPIDYTPGIFDIEYEKTDGKRVKWNDNDKGNSRVHTTLAKQMALYVILYSPLQMVADLPQHYENQPAFQFIHDVPTDWDTTLVLDAAIGDHITMARQHGDNWFVGALTDEKAYEATISLDFLQEGKTYEARIYRDNAATNLETNPTAITIEKRKVKKGDKFEFSLAAGGGATVSLMPVKE